MTLNRLAMQVLAGAVLMLQTPLPAQYATDFEALSAAPGGVLLDDPTPVSPGTPCGMFPPASQDCYYVPAGTTSVPWKVYTYSGNTLLLPQNPTGGSRFVAGVGPGVSGTWARAQRDMVYGSGSGLWTSGFDIAVTYSGTLPTDQSIGSFSIQPGGSQAFIALATWNDLNTAGSWNATYHFREASGATVLADTRFHDLAVNTWYRWETDFNLTTNEIWQIRIIDLGTGATQSYCPQGWYLDGGVAGGPTPTGFRLFAGSQYVQGNTVAFDNISITPASFSPEYQVNQLGATFTVNGISSTPCAPARVLLLEGSVNTLNLSGTGIGQLWDIGLTAPEPSVPASGGGFATASGQLVNLDLFAPSLTFLDLGTPFAPAALPLVFSSPIDVTGQMVIVDPLSADGLALSAPTEITVTGCQNQVDFDDLASGNPSGVYPLGWTDTTDWFSWRVGTGTVSSATGPVSGAHSPPNYMYAWAFVSSSTYRLNTCTFDTSGIASPTLSFALSRIGSTMGTLNVRQDDGTGTFSILLASYTGPEPTMTDWTLEVIPFIPIGGGARFQFEYIPSGLSTPEYPALDDVSVQ